MHLQSRKLVQIFRRNSFSVGNPVKYCNISLIFNLFWVRSTSAVHLDLTVAGTVWQKAFSSTMLTQQYCAAPLHSSSSYGRTDMLHSFSSYGRMDMLHSFSSYRRTDMLHSFRSYGRTDMLHSFSSYGRTDMLHFMMYWFLVHNLQLEQKFVICNLSVLPLTLGEITEGRNMWQMY